MGELRLMKGNEAFAEACIRAGVDAYFGYPITPQSEVIEYLMAAKPYETTGMVVLQAESEVASINMCYGAAGAGFLPATSSSSPGISLKMEGISYMAGAELPLIVLNVARGGPGLGDIQPAQSDYFQATKGGGHGDYRMYVLAPSSVQEMCDFVLIAKEMAFKYRNPVMILSDGVIGQMMEKVELFDPIPRRTIEEVEKQCPWATTGKKPHRQRNIITSLDLDQYKQERHVLKLMDKYKRMEEEDVRYEEIQTADAEYLIVAYGSSARICQKTIDLARAEGIKLGLLRAITVFPFPSKRLNELANQVKGMLAVEMSAGQMVEDVKLSVNCRIPVYHFGRTGGVIHTPTEVLEAVKNLLIK
ncbi:MAG: 3-methyl-2-oxobutanoate dehydrogenase subunit VorB [Bacteroidales bacterium]|nr:3-methyl-2-oxobutanoate dehydrogenase subunit VorB [Bacteroidales bacterium]